MNSNAHESHPLRVRGLKQDAMCAIYIVDSVASFTGAWIETSRIEAINDWAGSHPLRVRGLKQARMA